MQGSKSIKAQLHESCKNIETIDKEIRYGNRVESSKLFKGVFWQNERNSGVQWVSTLQTMSSWPNFIIAEKAISLSLIYCISYCFTCAALFVTKSS